MLTRCHSHRRTDKKTVPRSDGTQPCNSGTADADQYARNSSGEVHLYEIALVALVTGGNESVYFAFDLVLLIILRSVRGRLFLDGAVRRMVHTISKGAFWTVYFGLG